MKIYLSVLLFIVFYFIACTEHVKKPVETVVENIAIDFKSKRLVDLSESTVLKNILCQNWEYQDDAKDAENVDPASVLEMQYRGYCFFSDGTVVKDLRGILKIGKWNLVETERPVSISMDFANEKRQTEVFGFFNPTKIIFAGRKGAKPPAILTARGFCYENLKEDPFYPSNIWWMKKPVSPETDEEIKKRFKACIRFFVLFYTEYINVAAKKVSFVGLPSPYNWYAGGIILQRENKLSSKWINCFYNYDEAIKAYRLADKLVSKKYDWPKKERHWMKRNLAVLEQMEKRLDSIN